MNRLARLGEQGDEWVKKSVNSSPSARNRSRHGKETPGGSHERCRSWSETINRMLGRFGEGSLMGAR